MCRRGRDHLQPACVQKAWGLILVRTRPQRGGGPLLQTPKLFHGTMCFVGGGNFVLGTWCPAKFCFHHMCLDPKWSKFSGEFKSAQSELLLLLGPLCMGTRQVKQFCLPLSFFFFCSHIAVWPLKLNNFASRFFFFCSHIAVWPLELGTDGEVVAILAE